MAYENKVPPQLVLKDISYADLSDAAGISKLDSNFMEFLQESNKELSEGMQKYRQGEKLEKIAESELLIAVAKYLEDFLSDLFSIQEEVLLLRKQSLAIDPILTFKKLIVLKECRKYQRNIADLPDFDSLHNWLIKELEVCKDLELAVAKLTLGYIANKEDDKVAKVAMWACHCINDKSSVTQNWISFKIPKKIVADELIKTAEENNTKYIRDQEVKSRDGFELTDHGMSNREVKSELNHCIYCHDKNGDFCSTGFYNKKTQPELGYKKNAHGNELLGCPLEQKISEMNLLKQEGLAIAPLAMMMLDNPMCPLTGHRICNDCMQACVYQKQDPVDIPQIESRILKDVLQLPWGVELYDLFTKWNPLSQKDWLMKPYNGYKVMVMGMGPAGIAMSHYLLWQGCEVVGADGAQIPELKKELLSNPVHDFEDFVTKHETGGFGGVAEYGITARWNKKLLKLVYLSLARKQHFNIMGSTRFGGSITIDDVWEMGFDHLSIAVGAGLPKALRLPGSLAPGVISANSFLMSLHLNGASNKKNITDLQVELPAIVIGGGLTGVDTATEVAAYYIKQVESIYDQYELLAKKHSADEICSYAGDKLKLFLEHGREVKELRKQEQVPNFSKLIRKWGGVRIVYRKRMQDSPAYRNNHYELEQALQEGVLYMENLSPEEFLLDENGAASGLKVRSTIDDSISELAAKTILFATGSKPNVAYGFEHAGDIERKGFNYTLSREEEGKLYVEDMSLKHCKSPDLAFFSSYDRDGKRVSVIGDTNPAFHGSVVKAIASAKHASPRVLESMKRNLKEKSASDIAVAGAKIIDIKLQNGVRKITIKTPFAVKNHSAGNFFRLQNYKSHSKDYLHPIAAFPAGVDKNKGEFSFYLTDGYENNLIARNWQKGTEISVMGPAGVRTSVPKEPGVVVMFLDYSQIGAAVYIVKALQECGHRVEVVVALEEGQKLYADILADKLLIVAKGAVDGGIMGEKVDIFEGGMAKALIKEYSFGTIDLAGAGMVMIKGSASFVAMIKNLRFGQLKDSFAHNPKTTALVLGPMNCMLKGICAQCLQWQVDPVTGFRTKEVYACSWQDQPLEIVAIDHLLERDRTTDNVVKRMNKMLQ